MTIRGKRKALSGQEQVMSIFKANGDRLPVKREYAPKNNARWTLVDFQKAIAWVDRKGDIIHAIKPPFRRGIDEADFEQGEWPPDIEVMDMSVYHKSKVRAV